MPPPAARPSEPPGKPAAAPQGPRVDLAKLELEVLRAELTVAGTGKLDPDALARLAARLDAIARLLDAGDGAPARKPPAKQPTDRDRLQGSWRVASLTEGGKTTQTKPADPWEVKFSGGNLTMPYLEGGKEWKQRDYSFALDETKTPCTIDLIAKRKPVGRGIYEFVGGFTLCTSCHDHPFVEKGATPALTAVWPLCEPALKSPKAIRDAGLRLALSIDGKRPAKFGGAGVIVFALTRAATPPAPPGAHAELGARLELARLAAAVNAAQRTSEQAKEQLLVAEGEIAKARKTYELAEAKWGEANRKWQAAVRAYDDAKERMGKAAPAGEAFTVHVRALASAEKVFRVKATGKHTVLDGLVYAAEDVAIKSDAVSVWVVRNGAVLPVDLAAITRGDAKTNHSLKPGDQLFVQAKPAK